MAASYVAALRSALNASAVSLIGACLCVSDASVAWDKQRRRAQLLTNEADWLLRDENGAAHVIVSTPDEALAKRLLVARVAVSAYERAEGAAAQWPTPGAAVESYIASMGGISVALFAHSFAVSAVGARLPLPAGVRAAAALALGALVCAAGSVRAGAPPRVMLSRDTLRLLHEVDAALAVARDAHQQHAA